MTFYWKICKVNWVFKCSSWSNLSWWLSRTRIETDFWFNKFLFRDFQILNYLLKICHYCCQYKLLISLLSVFQIIELAVICWHFDWLMNLCWKNMLVQNLLKNLENLMKFERIWSIWSIKEWKLMKLMMRDISLHGVDDILMKIGRDLMVLWPVWLLTVAMQRFCMLLYWSKI